MNPMIREHELADLISNTQMQFAQSLYYLWTGKQASESQARMLDAILIAVLDHGPEALSTKTARMAASGGADMNAALAAGSLAASKHHGTMPIKQASELFMNSIKQGISAQEIVASSMSESKRVPGFGHRVYEIDPRTQSLLRLADELELHDDHVSLALEIEQELEQKKGKKLCLNVDGMIAALLPSLGIDPDLGQALFLIGRLPGMAYHIANEQKEKPQSMRQV